MNLHTNTLRYMCMAPTQKLMEDLAAKYAHHNPIMTDCLYIPRGSNVLAIAHLDTVADAAPKRKWQALSQGLDEKGKEIVVYEPVGYDDSEVVDYKEFKTRNGTVVNSIALDDRLGVWVITQVLGSMGIRPDLLFTIGEEVGASTAFGFVPPDGKEYNWMFQFDRHGELPVLYDYDDQEMRDRLRSVNMSADFGTFSDICFLTHLGIKGINWGVCYENEHSQACHANLSKLRTSVRAFKRWWKMYENVPMPHDPNTRSVRYDWRRNGEWGNWEDYEEFDKGVVMRGTAQASATSKYISLENLYNARNDENTHDWYRENRDNSTIMALEPLVAYCAKCGGRLYSHEAEADDKCSLCQGKGRPTCDNCGEAFLFGVEVSRGVCQDCAHDDDVWYSYLEVYYEDMDNDEEDDDTLAGIHRRNASRAIVPYNSERYCKSCGSSEARIKMRVGDHLVWVANYGYMCPDCVRTFSTSATPYSTSRCKSCNQELFFDEEKDGVCGDCLLKLSPNEATNFDFNSDH